MLPDCPRRDAEHRDPAGRVAASTVPVEYIGVDARALPLADASVDYVVSVLTLCTVPGWTVSLLARGRCWRGRCVRRTVAVAVPVVWGRVSGVLVLPLNTRPPGLAWSVRSIG